MSNQTSKQRLSCPFCGGKDIRSHHRGHPSSGEWVIECHSCSCELTGFATEQDAWKTWNGRWPGSSNETTGNIVGYVTQDRQRYISAELHRCMRDGERKPYPRPVYASPEETTGDLCNHIKNE